MKISDLLKKDTMILNLSSSSKEEVLDELIVKLDEAGRLNDRTKYKEAILTREQQSTTGLGEGIAIPHAKTAAVKTPAIAFGRSTSGIDFEALDGQPSHLFFMIAASEGANNEHLATLSKLSTFLMDENFRKNLLEAESLEDIIATIDNKEAEEEKIEHEEENASVSEDSEKFLLGVTGCPTGIAHTYMAADALKKEAQERGYKIKVETNGSGGVKGKLTAEDIERADGIIVAADTKVDMDRFDGKRIVIAPVADGVRKPGLLIDRALSGEEPAYRGSGNQSDNADTNANKNSVGASIYKHLMNGVSNMLPFVIGGGILIALSFVFETVFGKDNFIRELLMTIGSENAFALFIPVLAAFIAMSIADRPGFAPGLIAGYMAFNNDAGFLGGLIAGFLAGYIALLVRRLLSQMPQALEGLRTILFTPILNILITGSIMFFLVAPLASINLGLQNWLGNLGTGNMVILGIVLGAMMAIDMGGPINKAAYTFGIAMLDAGNLGPQAAVMAAGMVPPLGIAIATTFWKHKFTKQQRESGRTNYILGASFITEGAIPFAAADPVRVISASVIGAAVAGGLTGLFQIALPAPHGGIFTMFLVNGSSFSYIGLYALAILIGSVITGVIYGIIKKPIS
ncbi:PTS fructose transporter subunit IIC [Alkalihalobacillus alcalophilus ATCC 27647 = CGMCC 1.3604]|uniref:Fructose transporter n=1 Tax=Alkalihalobacillus alcalophilus ATCC 27647 = CGMCC 1.3604 TaxID=1218173 RepID=J8TL26_ALKAL|nr:PTS fructose transporter subunit IIABC [Alkalihalobacillus alcalophilus]AFV25744.1 fructose transporter [Alkalihalobacillus alcalophilus ATCC 27647 = CGMCC 1.3604]KGA99010.1 PTS fructose transporter subunit IIA [Alkalihalobacillus alcalophilus ATCC 27647 = CGMCC 1.3604]MED1560648.1 fructose-specific PTS transporter subunit EIIC [Alkalihalobacillus alcalophilus]THG89665.1 PTS fructose transporter subunit IIC [Alkalihalobacillus alcalophilus ATCC 27647 = CGMCC 1.3604]